MTPDQISAICQAYNVSPEAVEMIAKACASPVQDSREAFEKQYGPKDSLSWRDEDGSYKVGNLQSAWKVWQDACAWQVRADPSAPGTCAAFPERDPSKPSEQQGIFRKFDVLRVDGSDAPGGKHHGCRYFVLDMDHDVHAGQALAAYTESCRFSHHKLSDELRGEFGKPPQSAARPTDDLWDEPIMKNYFRKLVLRATHRVWSREISRIICRLHHQGVINSNQLHELLSRFDPTQIHCAVGRDLP